MPCRVHHYTAKKSVVNNYSVESTDELIRIYNRYPIAEVQVHARLGKDAYNGTPDKDAFRRFYNGIVHPVCYNGDIRSIEDFRKLHEEFPDLPAVMIGRGLVADPMLAEKIQADLNPAKQEGRIQSEHERLIRFHDDLCNAWYECYGQEHPTICRMLEIWDYLGASFPGNERKVRKIRKARDLQTYRQLAGEVLSQDYCPGAKSSKFPVGH